MPKATRADAAERVETIIRLIADGHGRSSIIRYAAEKWGIGERQTEQYLRRAYATMQQSWEVNRQDFLAQLMTRYENSYRRALKANAHAAAVNALNAMAKLARVLE